MSGVNPQSCQVFSFKQPSAEELEHDFLWRTTRCLPERGRIGIFNRSYYEEVLVVRVHPEILRNQGLSEELRDENNIWEERYRSIVDLENHLYRNGTRILKFFLHLSKDEQRKRFLERIDEPDKNWKFSLADIHERKYWKDYVHAYEECLNATSTHHAPWLRGSHITMEQTRVDGGIWMPERVEVRAAAKIFFVKSLVIDRILTYSEYRLPEAGMAATGASVIP
jgi:PPK2 family polyphosphate:nucleotide phosphotransferase